ncbi:MAG TPA: DUF4149 domain-containing protein [Burkholderiales bacterium]|nr:DUF4149 domain-containing protein [Burkholderiales bacterium]
MSKLAEALQALCVTIWAGGLWIVGLLVLPVLFASAIEHVVLPSVHHRLLMFVALIGLACAGYLLLFRLVRFGGHALRQAFFWVVVLLLVLDFAAYFGAHNLLQAAKAHETLHRAIEVTLRDRSATWFGLPSVIYLVQCALAVPLVLLEQSAPR